MFVETFLACFRQFYFMTPTEYFAWAIALCIVATLGYFQNALIFRILAVFSSRFLHKTNTNVFVETFLACFRQFYFLSQTEYFAWAIAFLLWPFLAIFKMLSFFEYKLFYRAVFRIEPL